MTFSPEQIAELKAGLSTAHIKTREQAGKRLSYIESWHAINEANRIFGYDGWSSETQFMNCVASVPRKIGKPPNEGEEDRRRDGFGVTYIAKVRITIGDIHRDGFGSGSGIDGDLGQAHESALKEAESDAQKRALRLFGNQFGLALYDKSHANVVDESEASRLKFIEECRASIHRIAEHPDPNDLPRWWNSETEKKKRVDFELRPAETLMLRTLVTEKFNAKVAEKKGPPV